MGGCKNNSLSEFWELMAVKKPDIQSAVYSLVDALLHMPECEFNKNTGSRIKKNPLECLVEFSVDSSKSPAIIENSFYDVLNSFSKMYYPPLSISSNDGLVPSNAENAAINIHSSRTQRNIRLRHILDSYISGVVKKAGEEEIFYSLNSQRSTSWIRNVAHIEGYLSVDTFLREKFNRPLPKVVYLCEPDSND